MSGTKSLPGATAAIVDHFSAILPIEQALIGGVMLEAGKRIPPLEPEEFMSGKHQEIWAAIKALQVDGVEAPADALLVSAWLEKQGKAKAAGGAQEMAILLEAGALMIPANFMRYAQQVRDASRERKLRQLGKDLLAQGFDTDEIERRQKEIPGPLAPAIWDWEKGWKNIEESWRGLILKTGIRVLDDLSIGLKPRGFLVIGARTSHGKTTFAVDLSLRYAQQGVSLDYFALEEPAEQIEERAVANLTGITTEDIEKGSLSPEQIAVCRDAVQQIRALPWNVTDAAHLRSLEEDRIVKAVSNSDAQVVIIDHLQKVQTPPGEPRVYGLERVCNSLHAIAQRDGKILILTAQLNRESETDKRAPGLADLRDSGGIEILARSIWLLYWPWKHDETKDPEEYLLIVAKQGLSGNGKVNLRFDARCGRFWGNYSDAMPSSFVKPPWGPGSDDSPVPF